MMFLCLSLLFFFFFFFFLVGVMFSVFLKHWVLYCCIIVCFLCRYCVDECPEVPMLFRNVPSLLIIFILTMPQPLRKGNTRTNSTLFYTLIHNITNTIHVHILIADILLMIKIWFKKSKNEIQNHTPDLYINSIIKGFSSIISISIWITTFFTTAKSIRLSCIFIDNWMKQFEVYK